MTTINKEEIQKFSNLAEEWWDVNGKFKPLHMFNPIRIEYITQKIKDHFKINNEANNYLKDLNILDIGCGGGLISEPMSRLGGIVTGIDASEKNIRIAQLHAKKNNLDIRYLKKSPEQLNEFEKFDVILNLEIIEHVTDNDNHISSTRIRSLIKNGYVRRANFELGSVYGFNAKVVKGAGRGKELSFPTANVIPLYKNQLMPKSGVYLVRGRFIGHHAFGMCNFGTRPTFGESKLVMEVHFFHDSNHDLYGKEIRVEFLERIRDEVKFPSSTDLINQLKIDKQKSLELKGKYE